ncbi:MAG TPA: response regulator [Bryobacteraceae bacterium]|nr:response regulator [Bryobacteraceae bacterium]
MPFILIVEDSDDIAALEIALTSLNGFSVKLLADGRQALALLTTDPPDLAAIITDLHLPFVDGFELLTAVRANERYRNLPIIVISGDNDPEVRNRIHKLGANAFFSKPYSPATIRHTLEGLLYAS